MKPFLIALAFAMLFSAAKGQSLMENKAYSAYKYVFKLDSSQTRLAYSGTKLDSSIFLTHLTDSFHRDSGYDYQQLKWGVYLIVSAQGGTVNYQSYVKHPFQLNLWGTNQRNFLAVKNLENEIIEDAKVTFLDGKVCQFTNGMGSYLIPRLKKRELIKVQVGDLYDYMYVNTKYAAKRKLDNHYQDFSYTTIAPGYLIFNQPKYKPLDTLKWKTYLLNDNGSPYSKRLKLYLNNNGKEQYLGRILAQTSGAYFGQFEIGDSLLADRTYEVIIKNYSNQVVKRNSFYLENYELKGNKFELQMAQNYYRKGQNVEMLISTLDVNNLPLMDANIEVKLKLNSISNYLVDRMHIPNKWFQEYYTIKLQADNSGFTKIRFPDSLFHSFNASYQIVATILDDENNYHQLSKAFSFNNVARNYEIYYKNDSLKVDYSVLNIPTQGRFRLQVAVGSTVKDIEITTPFSMPLNYNETSFKLFKNDTLKQSYYAPKNYFNSTYFDGERNMDSIHIRLVNPLNIKVYYELYKDQYKIAEGKGKSFEYHDVALGKGSYHMVWGHNYLNGLVGSFKVKSFHLAEKKLNISINQPEEIYPGQEVGIAIKVTDQNNKGVSNVNLSAYSVNAKFDNIKAPDVPYMGLIRDGFPLQYVSPVSYFPNLNGNFRLNQTHIKILSLYQNEFYQLFYGKKGINKIASKIDQKQAEFSVYVCQKHSLQNIVYIKVDDELVYHQYYLQPKNYSFPIANGVHQIQVRTFDRLLTYDDFNTQDSFKYTLGFNLDSIAPMPDTTVSLAGKLKIYEQEEFLNSALFVKVKSFKEYVKIVQQSTFVKYFDLLNSGNRSQIRFENNYYKCIGPIAQGELDFYNGNWYAHQILFERGNVYVIDDKEVVTVPIRQVLSQYQFLSNQIINRATYNFSSFNQLAYNPIKSEVKATTINPQSKNYKRTVKYSKPNFIKKRYQPKAESINEVQGYVQLLFPYQNQARIKEYWLINNDDINYSVIGSNRQNVLNYFSTGNYDLVLFSDTQYMVIKNLDLKAAGRFTLFISPDSLKNFEYEKTYQYEKRISLLSSHPLKIFDNVPVVSNPLVLERKSLSDRQKSKISGIVLDGRYQKALDNVSLYLEDNGYFKKGAISNEDGKFEMDNLVPGKYMLKIRVEGYKYQVIYNLKIAGGEELVLKINLQYKLGNVNEIKKVVVRSNSPIAREDNGVSYAPPMGRSELVMSSSRSPAGIIAGTFSGVNVSSNQGWTFAGSRVDGTINIVNGVNVSTEKRQYKTTEFEERMEEKLLALANIAQANNIRDVFRDYGYWEPNLITDNNGMAYCKVTFPDNITSWQTFVPAMNGNRQSGLASMVTKSFKPLTASLPVPRLLTEGDRLLLKGKSVNYTGSDKQMQLQFFIEGKPISTKNINLGNYFADSTWLNVPKGKESIDVQFQLEMDNGYKDGEKRTIPIRTNSILISTGEEIQLTNDTIIKRYIEADLKNAKLRVYNNEIDQLLDAIEGLKNYHYGCVEQTTSKLRALLAEKTIKKALGLPFTEDKMVRKMIKRLSDLRDRNGTWSWWGNGYRDFWLSAYVMKTLNDARLVGYSNNLYIKGTVLLEKSIETMPVEQRLYCINMLYNMKRKLDYDTLLSNIEMASLSVHGQFLYTRLQQQLGNAYSIQTVTKQLKHSPSGGVYFGNNNYNYKTDVAATTLIAYDILSNNDSGSQYLPFIKIYLYSSKFSRHTFAMAELINLQFNEALKKRKQNNLIAGETIINGKKLLAADYPYMKQLTKGDSLIIDHKGAAGYMNIIKTRLDSNPQKQHNYFAINNSIGGPNNSVRVGEPIIMKVHVDVYKSAKNVMLEIPIPAGFSYYAKPQGVGVETYREYAYDKTSIFMDGIAAGSYDFVIQLIPKFKGTFKIPPSKIELMYYPEIYNISDRQVIIAE